MTILARSAILAALVMLPTCLVAQETDPPLMRSERDLKTGKPVAVFNKYDKLTLESAKTLYIDTRRPQDLGRPDNLAKFKGDKILFYVFERGPQEQPKLTKFVPDEVRRIQFWEDMVVSEVNRLLDRRHVESAALLIAKLKADAPAWRLDAVPKLESKLEVTRAAVKADKDQAPDVREEGLELLSGLVARDRYLPGLEETFVSVHLDLAEGALKSKGYRTAREHLDEILDHYQKNDRALKFLAHLRGLALAHVDKGQAWEDQGNHPAASAERLLAYSIYPGDDRVRNAYLRSQTKYQVLRVAAYEKAGTFEPFNAVLPLEKQLVALLFDSPIEPDESGRAFIENPILKRYEPLPGGTSHILQMSGVTFSDGAAISAQDVAHTLKLLQDPAAENYSGDYARYVQNIRVKDAMTVQVDTAPHPRPETLFTFPVVPAAATPTLPKRGGAFSLEPIGSGPFRVGKPSPTGDVRLVANPRFREASKAKPVLGEVQFQFVVRKGAGQAVDQLERDQLHIIADPSPIQLVRLQQAPSRFRTRPFLSNSVWILAFNFRNKLFENAQVRLAATLAVDRELILKQYFGLQGQGRFTHRLVSGPFPPQSNAYDLSLPEKKADPAAAKLIIDGLKADPAVAPLFDKPLRLKYATKGDLVLEQALVQIKKDLEAAGFAITLEPKLPNDFVREVNADHDFDLAYCEVSHNNVLYNIESLFDPTPEGLGPGGTNYCGYRDQSLQQLFVALRREHVGDKIWKIQQQVHSYIYTQHVMIPLWRLDRYVAYTTRLKGKADDGRMIELPISNTTLFRRAETWTLEAPKL